MQDRFAEAQLRAGQEVELELRGLSMAPSLRDGDRLAVAPLGDRAAQPGEIVVARRGQRLIAHRLLRVDGERVLTRGDGCLRVDPPIAREALLGRVTAVARAGRTLAPPSPPRLLRRALSWLREWARSSGGTSGAAGAG